MDFDLRTLSWTLAWLSGLCWLIVSFPQFWEIYEKKSGRGLSLCFMVIWSVGDALNLGGCVLGYQLAMQLYIALWYLLMDIAILGMMAYYDWWPEWRVRTTPAAAAQAEERQALIAASTPDRAPTTAVYAVGTLLCIGGVLQLGQQGQGALQASGSGVGRTLLTVTDTADVCPYSDLICNLGMAMGWASCLGYLVARIPQIVQNCRRQSTDGLSIWMFVLAMLGNTTYSGSIFAWSLDPTFLWEKLPWLLGSLGTVAFDLAIFCQFIMYSKTPKGPTQAV